MVATTTTPSDNDHDNGNRTPVTTMRTMAAATTTGNLFLYIDSALIMAEVASLTTPVMMT